MPIYRLSIILFDNIAHPYSGVTVPPWPTGWPCPYSCLQFATKKCPKLQFAPFAKNGPQRPFPKIYQTDMCRLCIASLTLFSLEVFIVFRLFVALQLCPFCINLTGSIIFKLTPSELCNRLADIYVGVVEVTSGNYLFLEPDAHAMREGAGAPKLSCSRFSANKSVWKKSPVTLLMLGTLYTCCNIIQTADSQTSGILDTYPFKADVTCKASH